MVLVVVLAFDPFGLREGDGGEPTGQAPAGPTGAALPPPPGGPVAFEGVTLTLPPGWLLEDAGDGSACAARTPGACELQLVLPGVVQERGGALQAPRSDDDLGWDLTPAEQDCRSSRLVVRELAPVGDRDAEYREWDLDCTGEPVRLRLWWLPESGLALLDRTGELELREPVDAMVRGADLSGLPG